MLKIEDFKPQLNKKFIIPFSDNTQVDLTLFNIIEGKLIEDLKLTPFTLEFKSAPEFPLLRQGTYKIIGEDNKEYILLIIPRNSNSDGHFYDTIIS